jgi:hypothetical protein
LVPPSKLGEKKPSQTFPVFGSKSRSAARQEAEARSVSRSVHDAKIGSRIDHLPLPSGNGGSSVSFHLEFPTRQEGVRKKLS